MIDWQRVAELRDEIGTEDFDEVVDIFLEEVEETLERMHTTKSSDTTSEDMHFLKGSALNMGFQALSAVCEKGEALSEQHLAHTVDLTMIEECYQASKRMFLAELPDAFSA